MDRAEAIQWVFEGVLRWQTYEPTVRCELSSTAVVRGGQLICIDPIPLSPEGMKALQAAGNPTAIILTNGNHARAAAWFREALRVPVYAPFGAKGELELEPDVWFQPEGGLPAGLRAVPLPAAGPGEIALVAGEVVCVGDALIHLPSHGFALLPAKYCSDAAALPTQLRQLLACDFRVMTFAHGTPLLDEPRQRLATLLA